MDKQKRQTQIHIKTDFKCVFLLNGTFSEKADGFLYPAADPLYITVLPLSAHLLPYTVKLLKGKAIENESLCAAFTKSDNTYVKLLPRYNYIYTAKEPQVLSAGAGIPERLFAAVKNKNLPLAKKYLSENLLQTIDDNALEAFFADYTAILKDEFSRGISYDNSEAYFLIDKDAKGILFTFEVFDGLVDNIVSE